MCATLFYYRVGKKTTTYMILSTRNYSIYTNLNIVYLLQNFISSKMFPKTFTCSVDKNPLSQPREQGSVYVHLTT